MPRALSHILYEKILKVLCSLVWFGVYFDQIVSWKNNIYIYKIIIITTQGRPQDLAVGGKNFFSRFGNLHVAKRHAAHGEALLGGFGGMPPPPPPRNFFKMVQFGAFWCIFLSDFVFKKF